MDTSKFLCFTNTGTESITVTLFGEAGTSVCKYISYGVENWVRFSTTNMFEISLPVGDKVYLYNADSSKHHGISNISFSSVGVKVSGKLSSLISQDCPDEIPYINYNRDAFNGLFSNSNVSDVSELIMPTNTRAYCYYQMFEGCTNITTSPVLPTVEILGNSYDRMFYGCRNLSKVYCAATNLGSGRSTNWMTNVSSSGTFYKNDDYENPAYGTSGIPSRWTVDSYQQNIPEIEDPDTPDTEDFLTITSTSGTVTVSMYASQGVYVDRLGVHTIPSNTWTNVDVYEGNYIKVFTTKELREESQIYSGDFHITMRGGKASLSGKLTSILSKECLDEIPSYCEYPFYDTFADDPNGTGYTEIDASQLILPTNTTLGCYDRMFYANKGLKVSPVLPATTLSSACYRNMFAYCTALESAPQLPATEVIDNCYMSMFEGCTSLVSAPVLPATKMFPYCYASMFERCSALETPPQLPATELAESCYGSMFAYCTSIEVAPVLPVYDTTTSLTPYRDMFAHCSHLRVIVCNAKELGHLISGSVYVGDGWTVGVPENKYCTFYKNKVLEDIRGYENIPREWSLMDYEDYESNPYPPGYGGGPVNPDNPDNPGGEDPDNPTDKKEWVYLTVLIQGNGKVNSIDDNNIGGRAYPKGSEVILKAIPDNHNIFDKWSDESTDSELSFVINENTTVVAYFKDNGEYDYEQIGEPLDGLYINGKRVDQYIDTDIAMTYQSKDSSRPEATRTNYSKTVTLPATPNNNEIFSYLDIPHARIFSYSPKERMEYKLFINSDLRERGYCTLDGIVQSNSRSEYEITLYGGIGDFFFNLMYDEEGNEKTMDKLYYPLIPENDHIFMTWDAISIKKSWDKLKNPFHPQDFQANNYITAVPTYGGFGDDMDSDKAVLLSKYYTPNNPDGLMYKPGVGPVINTYYERDNNGDVSNIYTDRNGWVSIECQRELSEWEARDLRIQQQRPAIRTKLLFDAILDSDNNGGYEVELSDAIINDKYINNSWILLDRFNFDDNDSVNGIQSIELTNEHKLNNPSISSECVISVTNNVEPADNQTVFNLSDKSNVTLKVCAYPMIYSHLGEGKDSLQKIYTFREARCYYRDYDGNIIYREYQNPNLNILGPYRYPVMVQTYVGNAFVMYLTDNQGNISNVQVLMSHLLRNRFGSVKQKYVDYIAQLYNVDKSKVTINNVDIIKKKGPLNNIWYVTEQLMPLNIKLDSVDGIEVKMHLDYVFFPFAITSYGQKYEWSDVCQYTDIKPDFGQRYNNGLASWDWIFDEWTDPAVINDSIYRIYYPALSEWDVNGHLFHCKGNDIENQDNFETDSTAWLPETGLTIDLENRLDSDNDGAENGWFENNTSSAQNKNITKQMIFGQFGTAYDFLMSLGKLLNFRYRSDEAEKKVYIERTFEYYQPNIIDIQDKVDYDKDITIIPNVTEDKYVQYKLDSEDDLYINKLYKGKYHKDYDGYKVDTHYNLSTSVDNVFENLGFKGTSDYKMTSPYFLQINNVPQCFLTPWVKERLWVENDGGTSSSKELERTGYSSVRRMEKIEGPQLLCLYDREYSPIENGMTLVMFDGFTPWKCTLSDNLPIMQELNNKNCYLQVYNHFDDNIQDKLNVRPGETVDIQTEYVYGKPSMYSNETEIIAVIAQEIPRFSVTSTDLGISTLITRPAHPFSEVGDTIYEQYHQWQEDWYDINGKKVEMSVVLPTNIKPNDLLRQFYHWENSIWSLEKIEDYDITKRDSVKCTFIKVYDIYNYISNRYVTDNIALMNLEPEEESEEGGEE